VTIDTRAARQVVRTVRAGTLSAMRRSGLGKLLGNSAWRRRRLLIVGYHGISLNDEHEWSDLYISPEHFERRLAVIREEGCTVLPLAEGIRRLYDGTLPDRSLVITFDDGAYDFHARAAPILRRHALPATVYLTSYYCAVQKPVFNPIVSYLLWKGRGKTIDCGGSLVTGGTVTIPWDDAARGRLHARVVADAQVTNRTASEKDAIVRRLAAAVGVDYGFIARERVMHLMNRDEIRRLDRNLIDVELHTHRNRMPADRTLFLRELQDNRDVIRDLRGAAEPLTHFCYPNGEYAPPMVRWLREAGIVSATTCDPQIASAASHPLLLPRLIDTMQLPESVFRGWLSGMASFLTRRRSARAAPSDRPSRAVR
jgi:peptidoglycan/xylan/chitin deacetylase (PgdA/CDA1 family)